MAKIDLERYFNQLLLHGEDAGLVGVYIPAELHPPSMKMRDGAYYSSAKAQFGGTVFPAYANGIMAAISAILRSHGIPNVFLTDDIFICGRTREECKATLDKAVAILIKLGLRLQEEKITQPCQFLAFLGICIDSVEQRLSIPMEKAEQYARHCRHLLELADTDKLKVKDVESILGKLSWFCEVLIAGRARLSRLRRCVPGGGRYHPSPYARVELSAEAREDISWWCDQLAHAAIHPRLVPFWTAEVPIFCNIYSDASGGVGYGLVLGDEVYQGTWTEEVLNGSSCYKELVPVLLALELLPEEANGKVVIINTDNLSNVLAINKGTCSLKASREMYQILFRINELAADRNIYLIANWVPRESNDFCDVISKELWDM